MRFLNDVVLNAVSSAASQSSAAVDASQMITASVQAVFTDPASTGTVKLQCSNDHISYGNLPGSFTVTNWSDIPAASIAVGAGGVVLVPLTNICFQWVRVVFTRTAGAGTITATLKSVNY